MSKKLEFSASRLKKYRRCKREYAFHYIDEIKAPSKQKQIFGSKTHKQLENWLRLGEPPLDDGPGKTAKQGLVYLPPPAADLLVEHEFHVLWTPTIWVGGFIDLMFEDDDKVPNVTDHKTTSSLKWAMTEQDLKLDEQANIYVAIAMAHYGVPRALAKWVYYSATNPKSGNRQPNGCKAVEAFFELSQMTTALNEITMDFLEMEKLHIAGTSGDTLPPSPESCGAYGGCWYRDEGMCTDMDPTAVMDAAFAKKGW